MKKSKQEIAEDMLDGSCCFHCNAYFQHPKGGIYVHEYPVLCVECWIEATEEEQQKFQLQSLEVTTF